MTILKEQKASEYRYRKLWIRLKINSLTITQQIKKSSYAEKRYYRQNDQIGRCMQSVKLSRYYMSSDI